MINIDQDFFLPKSQTLFQNNYYAESWSILIYIDQYWSILIRNFFYQSLRLCFKTTFMPSLWSILKQLLCRVLLINIDLYWSILINIDQYWSILININQYRSGLSFTKFTDSVLEQLLCRVLTNIDLYWSILIYIDQYWSILINVDQDFSLPKCQTLFQNNYYAGSWSILINIDQYWSI